MIENGVFYYSGPNYAPPKPPKPTGPEEGVPRDYYTYTAVATDPDDDDINIALIGGKETRVGLDSLHQVNQYRWTIPGENEEPMKFVSWWKMNMVWRANGQIH